MGKRWLTWIGGVALLMGVVMLIFLISVDKHIDQYRTDMTMIEDAPTSSIALVFGAGVLADGRLSPALQDRVDTAAELYLENRVQKILMSGDNGSIYYDEVTAMKNYITDTYEISADDVVLDYAGFDTYDTCYRARDIFLVKEAILVTQAFHLPRALFICDTLGIEVKGVVADKQQYVAASWYELREFLARIKAGAEVYILKSKPKFLGEVEPIVIQ